MDTASTNFDAISYVKGASALRQLVTWMGDEDFLAGRERTPHEAPLRQRHPRRPGRRAGRGVAARGPGVGGGLAAAVGPRHHPGRARRRRPGAGPRRRPTAPVPRHGVRRRAGRARPQGRGPRRRRRCGCEDWAGRVVVPNAHGETFARLQLDERSWSAVEDGLGALEDDLARSVLLGDGHRRRGGRDLAAERYLALVDRHLPARAARQPDRLGRRHDARAGPVEAGARRRRGRRARARWPSPAGPGSTRAATRWRSPAGWPAPAAIPTSWAAGWPTRPHRPRRGPRPAARWRVVRRLAGLGGLDAPAIEEERRRDGTSTATSARRPPSPPGPPRRPRPRRGPPWSRTQDLNRRFAALAAGLAARAGRACRAVPRPLPRGRARAWPPPPGVRRRGRPLPRLRLDDAQLDLLRQALRRRRADAPAVWEDALDART